MFCRLFELKLATDIEVIPLEVCNDKCSYYISPGECSVTSDKEINLYKKERFNWNITRTIHFWQNEIVDNEDTLVGAIKLIHPSFPTIWILRWSSLVNNEISNNYSLYIKQEIKIDDIDRLNWYLKHKCSYDGRDLTDDDFIFKKGD